MVEQRGRQGSIWSVLRWRIIPSPKRCVMSCRRSMGRVVFIETDVPILLALRCTASGPGNRQMLRGIPWEGAVQVKKSLIDRTLVSLARATGLSPNSTSVLSN